jgi:hypothetical protein
MIYKLSYLVGFNTAQPVEVLADNEIELAHAILDMERDVGKICFGIKIEEVERPENFRRKDKKSMLIAIQRWAEILEKDCRN